MRKIQATGLCLALLFTVAAAQTGSITGSVTDEAGAPLPGANVTVEGTQLGASTDADGDYSVSNVPSGTYTVTASFIGYESASSSVTVGTGASEADFALAVSALVGADVFVTGTRAAGRTAMKSPTPIDGFDNLSLRRQGNGDFTETLKNQLPSFNATPLTGDGAAFVRPTSMRGLPPDNILVMTNSKRRHRSALISHFGAAMNVGAQAVDVGMIPSIAIKRLEVLRDGASAQYGSDAIAGVMNFILKDNSEGIEVQATGGQWMTAPNGRGGETDVTVAANIGMPLTDNGFINVSLEYADRPELSRGYQHKSAADGYKGWSDDGFTKDDDWGYVGQGTNNTDEWQTAMNWGRPISSGFKSVWNAGYRVSDNVEAYSFGNFADTYGNYSFFLRAPGKSGALTPVPLNPVDPSEGDFCWCDTYPLGFTPRLEGFANDFSSVVGIRGEMGNGVDYDFSASYGTNRINYLLNNTLNLSWGPYSPHDFEIGDLKQAETNLNADFSYPVSEALNVAFGGEWREEEYTMFEGQKEAWMPGPWATVHTLVYPDSTDENGDPVNYGYTAPGLAANGMPGTSPDAAGIFDRQNIAAYVDAEFEAGDLLVQAAGRFEDFSDFGTTTNFKVAGRYSIGNIATLRGNFSTGFRAPTPGQSNYTGVVTSFDGVTGKQVQEGTLRPTDALTVSMGGAALVPEEATNTSFGVTSNPISNLNLTFDMYTIDITNKIIKSRSLTVPEGSSESFTDLAFYTNSLDTKTTGFDLVVVYRVGNTDVSLALNHNETEVVTQRQVGGVDPVSQGTIDNLENNLPKDRITASVVQQIGEKMSAMARVNYYGETIDERSAQDVIDPIIFIDVELRYSVSDNLNVVFGANNATNAYPNEIKTRASQGMPYPRRSPLGYHGGMSYIRLMYNF